MSTSSYGNEYSLAYDYSVFNVQAPTVWAQLPEPAYSVLVLHILVLYRYTTTGCTVL